MFPRGVPKEYYPTMTAHPGQSVTDKESGWLIFSPRSSSKVLHYLLRTYRIGTKGLGGGFPFRIIYPRYPVDVIVTL